MSPSHATRGDNSVTEDVKAIQASPKTLVLRSWNDIEHWQRDNEFLINKYRAVSGSYRLCIASLTYLHNQTMNVYTHLLAVPLFAVFAAATYTSMCSLEYSTIKPMDFFAFGSFFAGAILCFGSSAFFHLVGNHSRRVYQTWLLFDLYGIFALITGTVYSGTYYGFYCEPKWWLVYSGAITVVTTCSAMLCTMERFRTPQWRPVRAILFISIGWSGGVPMTHAAQVWGIEQSDKQMGWWLLLLEGLFYILGAMIYAGRIPERFRPGRFDIFGASHQLFHSFAVMGAVAHLAGITKAFNYNHDPLTRRC